jgi:hypothetical protein
MGYRTPVGNGSFLHSPRYGPVRYSAITRTHPIDLPCRAFTAVRRDRRCAGHTGKPLKRQPTHRRRHSDLIQTDDCGANFPERMEAPNTKQKALCLHRWCRSPFSRPHRRNWIWDTHPPTERILCRASTGIVSAVLRTTCHFSMLS